MMIKWIREKPQGWAGKLAINTTGALISFVVTIMFFLTKFPQVWPVLVFLPLIILLFYRIRKHYEAVADQLRLTTCEEEPLAIEGNVIILPVAGITHVVENSLRYAQSLSASQIIAVHVPLNGKRSTPLKKSGKSSIRKSGWCRYTRHTAALFIR